MSIKKAVILLSGGLDSTTCLAIAKAEDYSCHALSFAYGQKNHAELERAREIAQISGATHTILSLPVGDLRGSALTDLNQMIADHKNSKDIPATYVPARNTIFLSFALALAETIDAQHIFIGANQVDYAGYPDCRPDYLRAFETMANLATKAGVAGQKLTIHSPLLNMSKKEIIQRGIALGVDYSKTLSCYRPNDHHHSCGTCDSCAYRRKGFAEAGIADPTVYSV